MTEQHGQIQYPNDKVDLSGFEHPTIGENIRSTNKFGITNYANRLGYELIAVPITFNASSGVYSVKAEGIPLNFEVVANVYTDSSRIRISPDNIDYSLIDILMYFSTISPYSMTKEWVIQSDNSSPEIWLRTDALINNWKDKDIDFIAIMLKKVSEL